VSNGALKELRDGRAPNADLPNSNLPSLTKLPNCRTMRADPVLATQEANYAHQQELDMIPLMMQKDHSPKG